MKLELLPCSSGDLKNTPPPKIISCSDIDFCYIFKLNNQTLHKGKRPAHSNLQRLVVFLPACPSWARSQDITTSRMSGLEMSVVKLGDEAGPVAMLPHAAGERPSTTSLPTVLPQRWKELFNAFGTERLIAKRNTKDTIMRLKNFIQHVGYE